MIALLAAHAASSFAVAWAAARWRQRGTSLREGAPDLLAALLLPGIGFAGVLLGMLLGRRFARTVRPVPPEELREPAEEPGPSTDPFPCLKTSHAVRPFEDVLRTDDPEELELALQRLASSNSPDALELLKEAARSTRAEIRVRVRAILVRKESRLMHALRVAKDPLLRARVRRKLAALSPDAVTARQHLEGAVRDYGKALGGRVDPEVRLEFAALLMERGEARAARDILEGYRRVRPSDPAGVAARMEASLHLGDRDAVRRDGELLRRKGGA